MTTGTSSAAASGQANQGGNASAAGAIVNGAAGEFNVQPDFIEWGKSKGIEQFEKYVKENPDFYKLANSYRNVEKLVGGDKLALPKDPNDTAAWDGIFNKLGRPEKAEGYKFADTADKSLTSWAGPVFHQLGLTQKQAEGLNAAFDKLLAEGEGQLTSQSKEKAAADRIQLEKDWGANFNANQEKATRAWNAMASATGISQAAIDKLQDALGVRDSMWMLQFFEKGLKLTGDTFEGDGEGQRAGGLKVSPEQAQTEKNKLLSDPQFAKKYKSGDKEARERLSTLNQILAGA